MNPCTNYISRHFRAMAPLRFRAWHPSEKIMILPREGDKVVVNAQGEVEYWFGGTKCEVQWSTGVRDEHGKEIYEGDILKWMEEGKEHLYLVSFQSPSFVFQYCSDGRFDEGEPLDDVHDSKIVGNLYENPDLILMAA
jgi:YopX protein